MKWKKHISVISLAIIMLTGLFSMLPSAAYSADSPDASKLSRIESIIATGDGSATELTIKLSSPATYTSYKTISPLRLVVDLSQTTQGDISEPILINKGNYKSVVATRYDTAAGVLTRVEILLERDSEALIAVLPANPTELKISFPTLPEEKPLEVKKDKTDLAAVTADIPVAAPEAPPAVAAPEAPPVVAVPEAAPASAAKALVNKTLKAISVENNKIILTIDGATDDFKTFRLNKPERFVIDLPSTTNGLPSRLLSLNASGVASARIGVYPDKLRIVLDAINGSFPEATAVKTETGLLVTLSATHIDENSNTKLTATRSEKPAEPESRAMKTAALPEKKTEVAAKTEELPVVKAVTVAVTQPKAEIKTAKTVDKETKPLGTSIEMIDFQVVDGISRLSVKVNGSIDLVKPVKTPGYVTLTIKNSTLPKNLQRSLETRSFVSPVLRVTPLAVKSKKGTDTKIRVATRVDAPFEYRQEGDMLYIDFKHPEGLSGDKLVIEAAENKGKHVRPKTDSPEYDEMTTDLAPQPEPLGKTASPSKAYKGRKVTLEFADAEVRKIFQLLSEVSNRNFVLGDEVTGNISLKLVNVPWDQALDIILDAKSLDKREEGNIVIIKGKGKFGTQEAADAELKKTAEKNLPLQPAKVFSVNYATLGDVVSQMEKLSSGPKGANIRFDASVISDSRTNKIIVVDTMNRIMQMQDLLSEIDLPEKQVMIEARIVEATSTFSRNLGVTWGVHSRDGSASFLGINSVDSSFGGLTSAPPTSGIGGAAGSSVGISFGTLASNIRLDTRLNAAASAGLIKIVSTPKVATLNNKAARISQGQSIPYTSSTSDKIETKFIAAELSLEVTPHINANGTISMKIDAKNDAPGAGNPPPINTKKASTEMLLRDGETTVIGGIYVDSDQDLNEGVPYLMDIPFLGNLFKTNTKSSVKTELLIFITPRILGAI